MSWVGGKKALRDQIVARFPLDYQRYIEVFGGAAWVLFRKPPGGDFEIYNDFDSNPVNLYRCVRDHSEGLVSELMFMLNSREDFEYMKDLVHSKADLPDIRRAAYYYALIRYSYASSVDSFGGQPHSMWRNFPLIYAASRRLQDVVVENKDCVDLISQNDRPESFFYCDPPYYKTEKYYAGDGFGRADHARLAETLLNSPIILLAAIPMCADEDADDDFDEGSGLDVEEFCVAEDHCCEDYEPASDYTGRCAYSCPNCGACLTEYIQEEFERARQSLEPNSRLTDGYCRYAS